MIVLGALSVNDGENHCLDQHRMAKLGHENTKRLSTEERSDGVHVQFVAKALGKLLERHLPPESYVDGRTSTLHERGLHSKDLAPNNFVCKRLTFSVKHREKGHVMDCLESH